MIVSTFAVPHALLVSCEFPGVPFLDGHS